MAAKQATGWGRKGVGMPILGGTAGEHGGGMPCLQPERECMDFLWSCCKSPHAQRLQRMHTAHLTVQEVRGPTESTGAESRCWQGCFFLEAPGENLFLHVSQLLEAACILSLCHIIPTSPSVIPAPSSSGPSVFL